MQNQALLEMLALEKFKENLKVAQRERIASQVVGGSQSSIWKAILPWAYARKMENRKPAGAYRRPAGG